MKLLVLGGTLFVGRHFVEAALKSGHDLTLFNRGKSGTPPFPKLPTIHGDRALDLARLGEGPWDAVVDFCGYHSRHLRTACEYFQRRTRTYLFISSVSAYKARGTGKEDEHYPLHDAIDSDGSDERPETYGARKVACERVVREAFGDRALIVRPGLVVGPFDPTDRFTYWPSRVARGGAVLAPGDPRRRVQFIDARDLADWTLHAAEKGLRGVYNASGATHAMREVLETCKSAAGSEARFVWVDDKTLIKHGAAPYTEIPLWIPGMDDTFDSSAAVREGLRFRPLRQTALDTLQWDRSRPAELARKAGLSPQREAELLAVRA